MIIIMMITSYHSEPTLARPVLDFGQSALIMWQWADNPFSLGDQPQGTKQLGTNPQVRHSA